jgi:SH3 domain protein
MGILSVNDTAGFTEVRTSGGTEGWIRSQYLVTEPIAKHRLTEALRQADRLQRELAQAKSQASDLASKGREQAQTNAQDQARIEELQQQLTDLQRISAGAVAQNDENRKLLEINQRLQDELDDIAEERNRLADNAENQAILIGAGLILLGLIAGALIKSRPQRSAWS